MSTPTFGMYSFLGKLNAIKVVDVPRKEGFQVDVAAIKAAVQDYKYEDPLFCTHTRTPHLNVLMPRYKLPHNNQP